MNPSTQYTFTYTQLTYSNCCSNFSAVVSMFFVVFDLNCVQIAYMHTRHRLNGVLAHRTTEFRNEFVAKVKLDVRSASHWLINTSKLNDSMLCASVFKRLKLTKNKKWIIVFPWSESELIGLTTLHGICHARLWWNLFVLSHKSLEMESFLFSFQLKFVKTSRVPYTLHCNRRTIFIPFPFSFCGKDLKEFCFRAML